MALRSPILVPRLAPAMNRRAHRHRSRFRRGQRERRRARELLLDRLLVLRDIRDGVPVVEVPGTPIDQTLPWLRQRRVLGRVPGPVPVSRSRRRRHGYLETLDFDVTPMKISIEIRYRVKRKAFVGGSLDFQTLDRGIMAGDLRLRGEALGFGQNFEAPLSLSVSLWADAKRENLS